MRGGRRRKDENNAAPLPATAAVRREFPEFVLWRELLLMLVMYFLVLLFFAPDLLKTAWSQSFRLMEPATPPPRRLVLSAAALADIEEVIKEYVKPAAAKAGVIAPATCTIPKGPTGLDPAQTSFFQALNIATKINKGSIEIINDCEVIKEGIKVRSTSLTPARTATAPCRERSCEDARRGASGGGVRGLRSWPSGERRSSRAAFRTRSTTTPEAYSPCSAHPGGDVHRRPAAGRGRSAPRRRRC